MPRSDRFDPKEALGALVVMAKRPASGQTKTRLSPPLSPEQAAGLYECFLLDTLDVMRQVIGVQRVLAFLPPGDEAYFQALAPDFELILQSGRDLGERLDNLLTHYLNQGFSRAVAMDSDSPTLPARLVQSAFEQLANETEVVLGPCVDGGYYLIGLRKPAPRLLREVQMSTPHVTADTLALAKAEGLPSCLLTTWYDVDDTASLNHLQADLELLPMSVAQHTRRYLSQLKVGR
jgi:hypothetical protein